MPPRSRVAQHSWFTQLLERLPAGQVIRHALQQALQHLSRSVPISRSRIQPGEIQVEDIIVGGDPNPVLKRRYGVVRFAGLKIRYAEIIDGGPIARISF